MKPKLLFTDRASELILEALGKSIDEEGFIIDSITRKRILTSNGEEIKESEFAGVSKDLGFFKNDLFSIMQIMQIAKNK